MKLKVEWNRRRRDTKLFVAKSYLADSPNFEND